MFPEDAVLVGEAGLLGGRGELDVILAFELLHAVKMKQEKQMRVKMGTRSSQGAKLFEESLLA